VTVIHLTPSLCHLLLNIPQSGSVPSLPQIRLAFFGGETLTAKQVERFQLLAPNAVVVNCYGATETPQVMSVHVIEPRSSNSASFKADEQPHVPIGRGIEGVQLLVLADGNRLCDVGETGEICVRTPYRASRVEDVSGRPCASLIPNPFSPNPDDQLYRTGDYGRYQADGAVVLLGRRDQQIKVRGFRVDLSEIERALEKSPGISRFVVDVEPRGEDHALTLYVVPTDANGFDVDGLRRELLNWLPPFMVPEQIVSLASLPQNPNGKVDRQLLRSMQKEKGQSQKEIPAAPTFGEQTIGVRSVQQRLQMFLLADEQGNLKPMDSLKLVEIACLVENEFKVRLPVGDLLQRRTLSSLAGEIARLQEQSAAAGISAVPPAVPEPASVAREVEGRRKNPSLIPPNENLGRAVFNRILQVIARVAPDAIRVRMHRWRGVQLGYDVSIGYDTIIETAFPWLVRIGNHTNIGMRATIIGHFRGMEHTAGAGPTVVIEDYAFVGPGVIILPNVTVGKGAVVAAGSVVSASIPPHCFAQGNPARVVARCGVPLSGHASYAEFLNRLVPISREPAVNPSTQKSNEVP
jgi:acetyltransferase-like isoleucine patch superfamily enzyme